MAQAGYTPIQLYFSTTAAAVPLAANLAQGELAINIADGKLYYENSSGVVTLLAGAGGAGIVAGSNTQLQFNNSGVFGASSSLTWDGTTLSSTQVNITGQGTLRLQDTTGGEYVGLRSPSALGASYTLTFPADDGTSGQALITDGSGVLSWSTAASGDVYGPGSSTDNAVARFDSTTGKLLQNSVVLIGDTGAVTGVTDLTASGSVTLSGGTANGVLYLNGSKVATSGSALTFNGTTLSLLASTATMSVKSSTAGNNSVVVVDTSSTDVASLFRTDINGTTTGYIGAGGATYPNLGGNNSLFLWNVANGPVVFATNNTERARILAGGNFGIGTNNPATLLDVRSGYITAGTASSVNGSKVLGGYYSNGNIATFGTEYSNGSPVMGYGVWPSTAAAASFVSSTGIAVTRGAYTIFGNSHIWYAGAVQTVAVDGAVTTAEIGRFDLNGGFLIGTTANTNGYKLVVLDNIAIRTATDASGSTNLRLGVSSSMPQGIATLNGTKTAVGGGDMIFSTATGGVLAERMRLTGAGYFGINTTSPNFYAHISTGLTTSITQPTAGSYGLYIQQNTSGSTGGLYIQDGASNTGNSLFIADNNGVGRVVVNGEGILFLNTTQAAVGGSKLVVNSGISTSSTQVIELQQATNGTNKAAAAFGLSIQNGGESTNAADLTFLTASGGSLGERARIDSSGNLLVGTTTVASNSVSTAKLTVASPSGNSGVIATAMGTTGTLTQNATGNTYSFGGYAGIGLITVIGADPSTAWRGAALVWSNGASLVIYAILQNNVTFSSSGTTVTVTNTSASSEQIAWSMMRLS